MSGRLFEVIWAPAAEQDLLEIVSRIAEDRPAVALDILARMRVRARDLVRFPQRGRIVPELQEFAVVTYRQCSVPPWRIIYRIATRTIFVVAVLDGRRDLETLLLERVIGR